METCFIRVTKRYENSSLITQFVIAGPLTGITITSLVAKHKGFEVENFEVNSLADWHREVGYRHFVAGAYLSDEFDMTINIHRIKLATEELVFLIANMIGGGSIYEPIQLDLE